MLRSSQVERYLRVRRKEACGFTLIEMVFVVFITMVLAAIAVPMIQNTVHVFTLRSSVAAFTGAIQATRYQAIYHGCPYQLAFKAATSSYAVASETPAAGNVACLTAMSTPASVVPLPGRGVTLNADVTLFFHPTGQVQVIVGSMTPMTLTFQGLPAESITVSNFGRVSVTP
jgi:Tfp pilus assembly protein FimT